MKSGFAVIDEQRICVSFGVKNLNEVIINGRRLLQNMSSGEFARLNAVMKAAGLNYNKDIAEIAIHFADSQKCSSCHEFCSPYEYLCVLIGLERKRRTNSKKSARLARSEVISELKLINSHLFETLKTEYTNDLSEVTLINNQEGQLRFRDIKSAVYHYKKHCIAGKRIFSASEYFEMARAFFTRENAMKIEFSEDMMTIIKIFDNGRQFGVLVRNVKDGDQWFIATFYIKS